MKRTLGIAHFQMVEAFDLDAEEENQLQAISEQTCSVISGRLKAKTFVVRCKRTGKHAFTSHDIERYVGAYLLQATEAGGVQMRGADETVKLELKGDRLFVVRDQYAGLGGYPVGCVAPVLSLISGGYDSSVASYESLRRGMEVHYCFFNLGGRAHEVGVKQVSHYLWDHFAASHRVSFVSVPFEAVVGEILSKVDRSYMGVVLKRMMYRAASSIAESMEIDALVTGESVSQVSSQTIRNLAVIDKVTDRLVLRPLSTWDKSQIIRLAKEINVAHYADSMPEYCAVISDKPTTAAKLERVLANEAKCDFTILDEAIDNRELIAIDKIHQSKTLLDEVQVQQIPLPDQVIVDIRPSDEQDKLPLILHSNEIVSIPFYKINSSFAELDPEKHYLLYCEKGAMSRMHAMHLRAEGFLNVQVYQPQQQKAGKVKSA